MAAKHSPPFGDRARDTERDARIAVQLDQVLLSPSFRTSKRCQALLSYVVHETLAERADRLKERTIGVDVFGREPTYDTNHDAVVRNAAAEVRKRLAQFYVEHEQGIRIELPLGSYVPVFAEPVAEKAAAVSVSGLARDVRFKMLASVAVAAALASLLVWRTAGHGGRGAMDRFWQPILEEREAVQLCVGQPMRLYVFAGERSRQLDQQMAAGGSGTLELSEVSRVGDRYLYLNDALAMFKLISVLQGKGKAYRPRFGTQTAYADLRGSPAVLVGAFNNDWTMRLTSDLRYYFWRDQKAGANMVADREQSGAVRWQVPDTLTRAKMQEDYALVTRLLDPATERTVISAAGITDYGTLAAAEFLSDPAYLESAFQKAPADWEKKNIQVVLKTRIVGGAPGPPTVEATYFWN